MPRRVAVTPEQARHVREALNLSQGDIARRLCCDRRTIIRYEQRGIPKPGYRSHGLARRAMWYAQFRDALLSGRGVQSEARV